MKHIRSKCRLTPADRLLTPGPSPLVLCLLMLLPLAAAASTTGAEFIAFYQFIYDAATGYLGRGIAITGGLVMMGVAAGTGKVVLAAAGMVLAIFGALGPTIIDQIFGSALIY
jgi:conjugal transfer pilus assembly protein TraA